MFAQHIIKYATGTGIHQILTLFRSMLFAQLFHRDAFIGSLLFALQILFYPRSVIGEAPLGQSIIPDLAPRPPKERSKLFFFIFLVVMGISLLIALLLGIAINRYGLSCSTAQRRSFFLVESLLWVIPISTAYALHKVYLRMEGYTLFSSVSSCITTGCTIVVLLLRGADAELVTQSIMWGTLIQACLSGIVTWKIAIHHLSSSSAQSEDFPLPHAMPYLMRLGASTLRHFSTRTNLLLDSWFAFSMHTSSVIHLGYALPFAKIPIEIIAHSASQAILPFLHKSNRPTQTTLNLALKIFLLSCLFTIFLWVSTPRIVSFLYPKLSHVERVTQCVLGYLWCIPFISMQCACVPLFYVYNMPFVLASFGFLKVACNLVLNTCFVYGLGYGEEFIAWATSLSAMVESALTLAFLYRLLNNKGNLKESLGQEALVQGVMQGVVQKVAQKKSTAAQETG